LRFANLRYDEIRYNEKSISILKFSFLKHNLKPNENLISIEAHTVHDLFNRDYRLQQR